MKEFLNGLKKAALSNKLFIPAILFIMAVILLIIYRLFILPVNFYYNKELYSLKNYNIKVGPSEKNMPSLRLEHINKLKPYFRVVKTIEVSPRIKATGRTTFVSPLIRTVSLKFGGYISEIYANKTGMKVRKGAPLFSLYSPSLINAENDYSLAYKNYQRLKHTSFRPQAETMYLSAEKKLLFWGINKKQLKKIKNDKKIIKQISIHSPINGIVVKKYITEGDYIKPSKKLYELANISKLWIKIFINAHYLKFIKKGERVSLRFAYYKKRIFHGIISYIYPYTYKNRKFIKVRISVANAKHNLKINSYVTVHIKLPFIRRLVVPTSCVAHIDYKDVVLIYNKNKSVFRAKSILIGARNGNYYPVIRGLKPKETVLKLKNLSGISTNNLRKINHYLILSSVKIKSL